LDQQPRSAVRPKNHQRDRLIRLAQTHPAWALGFEDETWWSRVAQPALHTWADGPPLRLVEQTVKRDDPTPKALACDGVVWRGLDAGADAIWLRCVEGRPLSGGTTQLLDWCCARLAALGKTAWLLVWDRAPWHESRAVRTWIGEHNRQVKQGQAQVRSVTCPLPSKSPWLNPIEPHWRHGKRAVVEPARLLSANELRDRVCAYYGCAPEPHLSISDYAP
jgi:DDE superfamily endonuclease